MRRLRQTVLPRVLLALSCLVAAVACADAGDSAGDDSIRVTLLGTGAPPPDPNRMGPATLVDAGGHRMLFDVGRGTSISLQRVGMTLGSVTEVFITHMHPDHIVGLPDFWLVGHLPAAYAQRKSNLKLFGPRGTKYLADGLEAAYRNVIHDWKVPGMTAESSAFIASEFAEAGEIFRDGELVVTAFRVKHTPKIPCYGYRIDYAGKTVIISGDTSLSEELIRQAQGADLVVHEVFYADRTHHSAEFLKFLESLHTTPEQVGEVLKRSGAKAGVVTHISSNATQEILLEGIRSTYSGDAYVGYDGMTFVIDDTVRLVETATVHGHGKE